MKKVLHKAGIFSIGTNVNIKMILNLILRIFLKVLILNSSNPMRIYLIASNRFIT